MIVRIDYGEKGDHGLDELVGRCCDVHIERMRNNHVWLSVEDQAGRRVTIHLQAKGTIHASVDDSAELG